MTTTPRVSVIMPVYNSARFLRDALESVAAQTYDSYEVVVVDGPSTDATPAIAAAFPRVHYMGQTGTGMWNAINEGVRHACGELLCFLSADDLWDPEKLRLQVELLDSEPTLEYIGARVKYVEIEESPPPSSFRRDLLEGDYPAYMPEIVMVRRELFDRTGGFDERHRLSADTEWLSRVRDARIRCDLVPQVLLYKRVHSDNLSSSSGPSLHRELLRIMREKVSRRRAAAG